jgi:hypothetical protein
LNAHAVKLRHGNKTGFDFSFEEAEYYNYSKVIGRKGIEIIIIY